MSNHPKRGLCSRTTMPDGRTDPNATWYYDWTPHPSPRPNLLPVPMVWGSRTYPSTAKSRTLWGAIGHIPADYSGPLLWLNEPMEVSQANVHVSEAVASFVLLRKMWPKAQIVGPQLLIGMDGQGTDYIGRAMWFLSEFTNRHRALTGEQPRLAALAFHNYISDPVKHLQTSERFIEHGRGLYGKRTIFSVSEWGVNGTHHADGGEAAVRTIAKAYDSWQAIATHAYFMLWGHDEAAFADFMLTKGGRVTGCGRGWGLDWK